jgi:glycerol-3-phosphate dehydrogenase
VGKQLGSIPPCATETRPLPGAEGVDGYPGVMKLADELAASGVVDAVVAKHLAGTYGVRARGLIERVKKEPILAERLDPELPHVLGQVDLSVEEEQAETVEDVLGRRVQLLLRARDQGLGATEKVARRMALKLGWDEARTTAEIARYREVVATTRKFRTQG